MCVCVCDLKTNKNDSFLHRAKKKKLSDCDELDWSEFGRLAYVSSIRNIVFPAFSMHICETRYTWPFCCMLAYCIPVAYITLYNSQRFNKDRWINEIAIALCSRTTHGQMLRSRKNACTKRVHTHSSPSVRTCRHTQRQMPRVYKWLIYNTWAMSGLRVRSTMRRLPIIYYTHFDRLFSIFSVQYIIQCPRRKVLLVFTCVFGRCKRKK